MAMGLALLVWVRAAAFQTTLYLWALEQVAVAAESEKGRLVIEMQAVGTWTFLVWDQVFLLCQWENHRTEQKVAPLMG
jgi:hypothetical protein